ALVSWPAVFAPRCRPFRPYRGAIRFYLRASASAAKKPTPSRSTHTKTSRSITCSSCVAAFALRVSVAASVPLRVGDAYDNALAETVIGLFKTEVIRRRGPWRSLEAVEFATL